MNRQIGVGDYKNVIVFDSLLTGHVIRRIRSGRVRIFNSNQRETLSLITQERIGVGGSNWLTTDKNAITRQWMVISTSNVVIIIDVGVNACDILSRAVGQTNRK